MNRSAFKFPMPDERLEWTGERYVSGLGGQIEHEHYHRYLFSLGFCQGKSVLDIACGEGYGSYLLGQVAASVIGVDIDRQVVAWANRHYLNERVSFRQGDATALPIDDQSIDIVVSFETVEHIAGQERFVDEVLRVLRPGGLFIVSSPNRPVYSGVSGEENPFHVHELDQAEFLDLLAPRFPHLKLFEQQTLMGSVIIGTGETSPNSVERLDSPDGTLVERFADESRAMYFIAIASQAPIPAAASSVFHSPRSHLDEIGNRERKIEELERARAEAQNVIDERGDRIAELERAHSEAQALAAEGAGKLAELERARAEAQRVVDERGGRITELDRLYSDARRLAEARAGKVAEFERALTEAQRVVDERGDKIQELTEKLKGTEGANAELTCAVTGMTVRFGSLLSERDAIAAERDALRVERDALRAERDAILASTLWQLTRPVRSAGRLVPPGVRRLVRGSIRVLWRTVRFQAPYRSSPANSG